MILMRHGQSEFNRHFSATRSDPGIIDPALTPDGHIQASRAAEALANHGLTQLIVSPYTRALQTAEPFITSCRLPARIDPLVRERYVFSCDIGSPPENLAERFPHHDFSHLPPRWWPDAIESEESIINRAGRFRAMMTSRDDWASTLVVTHWAFILALTGVSVTNGSWIRYDPTTPPPKSLVWHP